MAVGGVVEFDLGLRLRMQAGKASAGSLFCCVWALGSIG
jgi:hypothetical protein